MSYPGRRLRDVDSLGTRLPDFVRELRRQVDMSQRELAEASGVNKNTIAGLESEQAMNPRLLTLERLAHVAGWHLVFVDGKGQRVSPYRSGVMTDDTGRELPPHLDPRPRRAPEYWWERKGGHTFTRDRARRDEDRRAAQA